MKNINFNEVSTPAYIVDERLLEKNLKLLAQVMERTGCKILLAQKGFSMYSLYPLIGKYLSGTTASSLYEAKLGKEEMGKETHIFAPAYKEEEFAEIVSLCDHIVFNSLHQYDKFRGKTANCGCGIRVNPEYAEVEHEIYNPCCAGSRLGTTLKEFEEELSVNPQALDGIEGIHFHVMCEQNSDTLERVLAHLEEKFGKYMAMEQIKWVNFGGGHHITRSDYDVELLVKCINHIKSTYDVQVYLEPGEAVALNTGYLVAQVLEVQNKSFSLNQVETVPVILDASAACHMPDVLEMPYRPEIIGAGKPGEKKYCYRFGGNTCLAGDIIGDYSFDYRLKAGDKLVFCDMAHYSMVKNNTFNGIALPDILSYNEERGIRLIKRFGYENFKTRLS
ncbi:MAG: carboxynorspermidine decarboxylase [Lachnospira sp.]|nr:carboxynorspermidine decarboxylase [Lachnospira sp.]